MSTTIVELTGKSEITGPWGRESNYVDAEIHVSSFYGGEKRGKSIQITIHSIDSNDNYTIKHIQLDNETAKKLLEALKQLDF